MRKVIRFYTGLLFCLALFTSAVSFAGEVNVKKLSKKTWTRVESENFIVLSDAGVKKSIEMLEELENFGYFMRAALGYKQNNLTQKVPVILSRNGSSFRALGIPKKYAGIYLTNFNVVFARADKFRSSSKSSANWGRSVVLHELVHLLVNNTPYDMVLPPWFNEGIAEYFSTYQTNKNEIIIGDMSILGNRFYSMLKGVSNRLENVDTESLFKTVHDDLKISDTRTKKKDKFIDKFYARSAGTVHYLFGDNERRKQMYFYLALLGEGYGIDESFNHAFKMTFAEFDEKVNDYLKGRYVVAGVFLRGPGGIEFPEVKTKVVETIHNDSMIFLYNNISLLSDDMLGEGNREKMNTDFENLYPDFFDE